MLEEKLLLNSTDNTNESYLIETSISGDKINFDSLENKLKRINARIPKQNISQILTSKIPKELINLILGFSPFIKSMYLDFQYFTDIYNVETFSDFTEAVAMDSMYQSVLTKQIISGVVVASLFKRAVSNNISESTSIGNYFKSLGNLISKSIKKHILHVNKEVDSTGIDIIKSANDLEKIIDENDLTHYNDSIYNLFKDNNKTRLHKFSTFQVKETLLSPFGYLANGLIEKSIRRSMNNSDSENLINDFYGTLGTLSICLNGYSNTKLFDNLWNKFTKLYDEFIQPKIESTELDMREFDFDLYRNLFDSYNIYFNRNGFASLISDSDDSIVSKIWEKYFVDQLAKNNLDSDDIVLNQKSRNDIYEFSNNGLKIIYKKGSKDSIDNEYQNLIEFSYKPEISYPLAKFELDNENYLVTLFFEGETLYDKTNRITLNFGDNNEDVLEEDYSKANKLLTELHSHKPKIFTIDDVLLSEGNNLFYFNKSAKYFENILFDSAFSLTEKNNFFDGLKAINNYLISLSHDSELAHLFSLKQDMNPKNIIVSNSRISLIDFESQNNLLKTTDLIYLNEFSDNSPNLKNGLEFLNNLYLRSILESGSKQLNISVDKLEQTVLENSAKNILLPIEMDRINSHINLEMYRARDFDKTLDPVNLVEREFHKQFAIQTLNRVLSSTDNKILLGNNMKYMENLGNLYSKILSSN